MLPKLYLPEYTLTLPVSKKEVKYKPYTAGQQKILLIARESENDLEILEAIERITSECSNGLNTSSLCAPDFEYLYLKIRAISEGQIIPVKITHTSNEKCKFDHIYDLNIDEIYFEEGDTNNIIDINETIGITLKYPSIGDFKKLKEFTNATEMTYFMLKSCISNVFDGEAVYDLAESSDEEITEFFESLSPEIITKIEEFLSNMPQIYLTAKYTCPKCGEIVEENIKQLNNFF